MADEVVRQGTMTLAGQVATFTPKAGTGARPDHLTINSATITFAGNAALFINNIDDYEISIQHRTRT